MSVKMMTTEQLQNDLAHTFQMWGGGIPPEQNDRVNALRAELKRRGATEHAARQELPVARGIEGMTDEQLAAELRGLSDRISKNPSDETLQERFADVRFELRKRTKNGNGQVAQSEPKPVTGNFDPNTGETHMQQMANGNGHDRLVPRQLVHDAEAAEREEQQKQAFMAAQAERVRLMEQAVRKHNLAKTAADVAATMLTSYKDPNGDDIENVCTIALQVAQNIFVKVGL